MLKESSSSTFSSIRGRLRLLCDGIDGSDMSDMNYTTSGYAPLSGRLVQAILTNSSLHQGRFLDWFFFHSLIHSFTHSFIH